MLERLRTEFPYLPLATTAEANGVAIREHGLGRAFVFVPGMTGGGQATLELAVRCVVAARARGAPRRLVVVDYTYEEHPSLEALQDTVVTLLGTRLGGDACVVWTESLGNLVAPPGPFDAAFGVERRVMLSPFAAVPGGRLALGLLAMALAPDFLYRATIGPLGRFFFGPAGDRPEHVFYRALAATGPAAARRRSGWLRGRDFTEWFARGTVPTHAFIGTRDRLVSRAREAGTFERLARERPGFAVSFVAGAGHVVTDSAECARLGTAIDRFCLEGE